MAFVVVFRNLVADDIFAQYIFATDVYGVAVYDLVNLWRIFHDVADGSVDDEHTIINLNSVGANVFKLNVLVVSVGVDNEVVFHTARIGHISDVGAVVNFGVFHLAEFSHVRSPFRFVLAYEVVAVVGCSIVARYLLGFFRVTEDYLVGVTTTDGIFVVPFVLVVGVGVVSHLYVGEVE